MKLFRAFLVTLVLATACDLATAEILIGTWNVRNYLLQNRWDGEQFRFAYPKPESEKAVLRELILKARADVLLLQEIGSDAFLRELQEDLAAGGLEYPFRHLSIRSDGRIGLAILAMEEPDEIIFHDPVNRETGLPVLQRGIQEILFSRDGKRLRVFHVHLKSRYTSDESDPESIRFRKTELELLRSELERRLRLAGAIDDLLLAGDFNATFDSEMLGIVREKWQPVPVTDAAGKTWTYHHYRTGRQERIDGFWVPEDGDPAFFPGSLYPVSGEGPAGSDHRLVLIEWRPGILRDSSPTLPPNP